jgi:multiple sugar transport system permease protein
MSTQTKSASLAGVRETVKPAAAAARGINLASVRKGSSVVFMTLLAIALLGMFLSPFLYMIFTSLKTQSQVSILNSPLYPATYPTFEHNGEKLEIFIVPLPDGDTQELAMLRKGQLQSVFIDPANLDSGEIVWDGSWRLLDRPWVFAPTWENYTEVWEAIDFPNILGNTAFYAGTTVVATLISCTLVAFGFSRFRFPGRDFLFVVLISTIFLPAAVTIVPTYAFWQKLGLTGSWWPLILPVFFANAYNVFLLRQYFMTLPRELDEAAMMDGAGPLRILWSVILPQSIPALIAVSLFHIVWAWNDYFGPLLYLSTSRDNWPISVALSIFNGIYGARPELIQAGALMGLIIPLILFFFAQRFFVQGVVITGVEK